MQRLKQSPFNPNLSLTRLSSFLSSSLQLQLANMQALSTARRGSAAVQRLLFSQRQFLSFAAPRRGFADGEREVTRDPMTGELTSLPDIEVCFLAFPFPRVLLSIPY